MQDLAKRLQKMGKAHNRKSMSPVHKNSESQHMIAKCIVGSSLVKTAIFGEDLLGKNYCQGYATQLSI